MIQREIDRKKPLTEKQKDMLKALEERPVTPDETCRELTAEELSYFRRVAERKRKERCKQTVTLRISPEALKKAKMLGKGYTSVLSRILEEALDSPETIRHNL